MKCSEFFHITIFTPATCLTVLWSTDLSKGFESKTHSFIKNLSKNISNTYIFEIYEEKKGFMKLFKYITGVTRTLGLKNCTHSVLDFKDSGLTSESSKDFWDFLILWKTCSYCWMWRLINIYIQPRDLKTKIY